MSNINKQSHYFIHRLFICLIALGVVNGIFLLEPPTVTATANQNNNVSALTTSHSTSDLLVIYDSLAIGSKKQGNITELKRLLTSLNISVQLISHTDYREKMINDFQQIIVVRNEGDRVTLSPVVINDMNSYKGKIMFIGGIPPKHMIDQLALQFYEPKARIASMSFEQFSEQAIHLSINDLLIKTYSSNSKAYGQLDMVNQQLIVPYAISDGSYSYVTFYEKDSLSTWSLALLLQDWLAISNEGGLYLMFNEVSPFTSLEKLREVSKTLNQAGIPFMISVKPIFANMDSPAATRYVETLQYIQALNGSILIDTPAVANAISADISVLKGNIASFIDFLAQNEVSPLGATAELYWLYDDYYVEEGLSFYNSIIALPDKKVMSIYPTAQFQKVASSTYSLSYEQWQQHVQPGQVITHFPIDLAITIDWELNSEQIDDIVQTILKSWYVFKDYKTEPHQTLTEQYQISSDQGRLLINNELISNKLYYEDVVTDNLYVEVVPEANLQQYFDLQNRIFITIIIVILIVFFGLFVIGSRMYRDKYKGQGRNL